MYIAYEGLEGERKRGLMALYTAFVLYSNLAQTGNRDRRQDRNIQERNHTMTEEGEPISCDEPPKVPQCAIITSQLRWHRPRARARFWHPLAFDSLEGQMKGCVCLPLMGRDLDSEDIGTIINDLHIELRIRFSNILPISTFWWRW